MKVRFVLLLTLAAVFAAMLTVQAIAIANAATPAGDEYNITGGGDQYIGTGTTTTATTTTATADNGTAAGSVYSGASSLPSTGVFLLIPAAGLAATGLGALMMKKRG